MIVCPDDGETSVSVSIPLDEIKVKKTRGHKKDLKISDELILQWDTPVLKHLSTRTSVKVAIRSNKCLIWQQVVSNLLLM